MVSRDHCVCGYPLLAGGVLAVAGDEANVIGFLIWGGQLDALANSASTTRVPPYTWIDAFDGAVLNEDAVAKTDASAAGGSFNLANIKGAAALANVKWVSKPAKIEIQTN